MSKAENLEHYLESIPFFELDLEIEVGIIGNSGVGKSSFALQFCTGSFQSYFSTISPYCSLTRRALVDDKSVQIHFQWDQDGNGLGYYPYSKRSDKKIDGVIMIYDVTNQVSFMSVQKEWLKFIRSHFRRRNIVKMLIGNKIDISEEYRDVELDTALAQDFAQQHKMLYFETSCYDGTNVELAVMTMVAKIMECKEAQLIPSHSHSIIAKIK